MELLATPRPGFIYGQCVKVTPKIGRAIFHLEIFWMQKPWATDLQAVANLINVHYLI